MMSGTRRGGSARAETAESATVAAADWGPGLIVPPLLRLEFKRGPLLLRPTLAVPRKAWDAGDPLRRAVWSVLASAPVSTAQARRAALKRFADFLGVRGRSFAMVDPMDVAEYIIWRVAIVPGVDPPERGPVEPATAMAEVAHIRAHAALCEAGYVERLYSTEISALLKRLGAGERPDGVRKTPVALAQVRRIAQAAVREGTPELVEEAFLITLGFFMFMRGGEFTHIMPQHLIRTDDALSLTWVRTKTRSAIARHSVTRICKAPLLLQVYDLWSRVRRKTRTDTPVFPNTTTATIRDLLRRRLGHPPVMPGEPRALPWSMRAGAATQCFICGMDPERIMRLGRWSSRVALLYCVLTPQAQAAAWDQQVRTDWWSE